MAETPDSLSKPRRVPVETRMANTSKTAKSMLEAETAARAEKTEKLRALRLAKVD